MDLFGEGRTCGGISPMGITWRESNLDGAGELSNPNTIPIMNTSNPKKRGKYGAQRRDKTSLVRQRFASQRNG